MRANDREQEHERDQPRCDRDRREPEAAQPSQRITRWERRGPADDVPAGRARNRRGLTRMSPRFHRSRRPAIDRPRRGNVVRSRFLGRRPKCSMSAAFLPTPNATVHRNQSCCGCWRPWRCLHALSDKKGERPSVRWRTLAHNPSKMSPLRDQGKSRIYERLVALVAGELKCEFLQAAASTVSPSHSQKLGGAKLQSSISRLPTLRCAAAVAFFRFQGVIGSAERRSADRTGAEPGKEPFSQHSPDLRWGGW